MEHYFFNDINLTMVEKKIIQGFQMIREALIIKLYTMYGVIEMKYDNLNVLIDDYEIIHKYLYGGLKNEKED